MAFAEAFKWLINRVTVLAKGVNVWLAWTCQITENSAKSSI